MTNELDTYGFAQPVVRKMCDLNRGAAYDFLLASRATRHYVCLAVMGWQDSGGRRAALRTLATDLFSRPRHEVLATAYPRPKTLLRLCARLGRPPFAESAYRTLVSLATNARLMPLIWTMDMLTERTVRDLASLDAKFVSPANSGLIERGATRALTYALAAVRRHRPDLTAEAIRHSLRRVKDHDTLARWAFAQLRSVPLFTHPWDGNDDIRPLRTMDALTAAGTDFMNCLRPARVWADVVSGKRAYYRVTVPSDLIVSIIRDGFLGWRVEDIRGVRNIAPNERLREFMLSTLSQHDLLEIEPDDGDSLDDLANEDPFEDAFDIMAIE